ncbi:MAG: hypothetical protein ACLQBX_11780 [Candidatus Limnocylindrales bacterium]
MADLAERILAELQASTAALDDDQLAARLGVARQAVNQASRRLAGMSLIGRGAVAGGKIFNWRLSSAAAVPPAAARTVTTPSGITSGRAFEDHARAVLSQAWGVPLAGRVVTLRGRVTHSFDLVSADESMVGDAKWFKDLQPIPAAKLSVIAEYVWLLQHVEHAQRRFLVFGHDRAVPERWLRRFRPMLDGVEFWFLDEKLARLA